MPFLAHARYGRTLLFFALCLAVFCSAPTTYAAPENVLKSRKEVEKTVGESIGAFLNGRALQVGCMVRRPHVIWKGVGETRTLGGISVDQVQALANKYNFSVEFFEMKGSFDSIVAQVGGQNVTNLLAEASDASAARSGDVRLVDMSV